MANSYEAVYRLARTMPSRAGLTMFKLSVNLPIIDGVLLFRFKAGS